MSCPRATEIEAYFDDELGASAVQDLERHLKSCAECGALLADLERLRRLIRREMHLVDAGNALPRIRRAIDELQASEQMSAPRAWRSRLFWIGSASGLGVATAVALVVLLFTTPLIERPLIAQLVSAHVDALSAHRTISVESTDRHTVKPWFAGRADVSPEVQDFAAEGYPLRGGRVDSVAGQRAPVLVYQHGLHEIDVFVWRAHSWLPLRDLDRRGFHLVFWRRGDLQYGAVSDAGWAELRALEGLFQRVGAT